MLPCPAESTKQSRSGNDGCVGSVTKVVAPQNSGGIGHPHRHPRVPRVRRLNGIHSQRSYGINCDLFFTHEPPKRGADSAKVPRGKPVRKIVFTTALSSARNHWQQSIFVLNQIFRLKQAIQRYGRNLSSSISQEQLGVICIETPPLPRPALLLFVQDRTTFPGMPITIEFGGILLPGGTTAPAATTLPSPMTAPSRTVLPIPITQ